MPRPNVASRPVCRYHNVTKWGCLAGEKCHYLHASQKCSPYEENKVCRFYAQGYCKRGNECWYKHVDAADVTPITPTPTPSTGSSAPAGSSLSSPKSEKQESNGCPTAATTRVTDGFCGICFEEKPALYGLLSRCSHSFCLNCIRQWRDPKGKSPEMTDAGIHKTCPICRAQTKFVVPSSRFYPQDDPRKVEVLERYKRSMARVPCRHFVKSNPKKRFCPFGRDCFYQHANADGTPYEFSYGVDTKSRAQQDRETEQLLSLYTPMLEFFHEWIEQDVDGISADDESFEF